MTMHAYMTQNPNYTIMTMHAYMTQTTLYSTDEYFQKFPRKFAKCGKNDPFYDKFFLKQVQFLLPGLPKRGGGKKFPCLTPGTKIEGVTPRGLINKL